MNLDARRVLEQALQLPPLAREEVAAALLRSISTTITSEIERAWSAEIDRRLRDDDPRMLEDLTVDEALRRMCGERHGDSAPSDPCRGDRGGA